VLFSIRVGWTYRKNGRSLSSMLGVKGFTKGVHSSGKTYCGVRSNSEMVKSAGEGRFLQWPIKERTK